MAMYQSTQYIQPNQEYFNNMNQQPALTKRKREEDQVINNNTQKSEEPLNKQRQPKSLFRPWSTEEQTPAPKVKMAKTSPKTSATPIVSYQTPIAFPPAPVLVSPYQMAVQQQQRQTAMAMQQAVYQRQLMMAHIWARQHAQHQQMQLHHHHLRQQQQQLFVFGAQQGPK